MMKKTGEKTGRGYPFCKKGSTLPLLRQADKSTCPREAPPPLGEPPARGGLAPSPGPHLSNKDGKDRESFGEAEAQTEKTRQGQADAPSVGKDRKADSQQILQKKGGRSAPPFTLPMVVPTVVVIVVVSYWWFDAAAVAPEQLKIPFVYIFCSVRVPLKSFRFIIKPNYAILAFP